MATADSSSSPHLLPTPPPNRESVSSIQLALDLEHSLNDDHPPAPAMSTASEPAVPSFDPEVLTSIVIQLRAQLAKTTQELDESNQALADAGHKYASLEARNADLQELLDTERLRSEKAEKERDDALKLAQENDEQVNLLRSKVEESRRGLMRLQAESRRMSTVQQTLKTPGPLPLDLSLRTPASSKRQSFQITTPTTSSFGRPAAGGGHRRISSMSDPGQNALAAEATPVSIDGLPPSPATLTFEDIKSADGSTIKTKRLSLVAASSRRDVSPPSGMPPSSILMAELDSLRTELASTKKELDGAKHDLAEAADKRDASEACIKALREFIAEQALDSKREDVTSPVVSLKGLKLPPLPTEQNIDDSAAAPPVQQTKSSGGGWGLNLWGRQASNTSSTSASAAAVEQPPAVTSPPPSAPPATAAEPSSTASTPLTSFVSSWTRSVSGNSVSSPSQNPSPSPNPVPEEKPATARKFSFFTKPANPPLPNPVTGMSSSSSKPPSISSTATPELTRSRSESTSTSPQTETYSIVSGGGGIAEEAPELEVVIGEPRKGGDVTPTSGHMEAVAL